MTLLNTLESLEINSAVVIQILAIYDQSPSLAAMPSLPTLDTSIKLNDTDFVWEQNQTMLYSISCKPYRVSFVAGKNSVKDLTLVAPSGV